MGPGALEGDGSGPAIHARISGRMRRKADAEPLLQPPPARGVSSWKAARAGGSGGPIFRSSSTILHGVVTGPPTSSACGTVVGRTSTVPQERPGRGAPLHPASALAGFPVPGRAPARRRRRRFERRRNRQPPPPPGAANCSPAGARQRTRPPGQRSWAILEQETEEGNRAQRLGRKPEYGPNRPGSRPTSGYPAQESVTHAVDDCSSLPSGSHSGERRG